ncbi:MAG: hypothetical protein VR65_00830 [Desulfobulbaceae bacterium BRH_c16a]|nr:MAG: hypothetical protein VR65_00830 [Desulfobulbaceae bacterium BRH_c16a]
MKNFVYVTAIAIICLALPSFAKSKDIEHVIRCESNDFASEHCQLPPAPRNAEIKEVRMVRQHSTKPCIEGKSWEADYDGIIVSRGCRADFSIVYQISDRSDRRHRQPDYSERHPSERSDRYRNKDEFDWGHGPSFRQEDPAAIVLRSFEEILNRRPSREEFREYQYLIINRNWTERDIRDDLRQRRSPRNRY